MARTEFKLDKAGVGAILRSSAAHRMTMSAANRIGAIAAGRIPSSRSKASIEVRQYTTDRGAAAVVLADPRGAGIETKYGVLRGAAAAAGISVKARR